MQEQQDICNTHHIATGILQLCAVSSLPLCSAELAATAELTSSDPLQSATAGRQENILLNILIELGAVPLLLRLHSLSYPCSLREGARRVLKPLLQVQGDAVRAVAEDMNIPQPVGTSAADWVAWWQEFRRDLYGELAV